jgi:hypothetical protein
MKAYSIQLNVDLPGWPLNHKHFLSSNLIFLVVEENCPQSLK